MPGIKTIAMYLPQYHRVKENDEWWGSGFTEWRAVRASRPLFRGHEQPRQPFNNNYYDLLNQDTMIWQAALMHRYNIGGAAFYHYWFKDGRKILEKPAENLLLWQDIDMPFCFCWANGSWARTWSTIGNWSWSPLFDPEKQDDCSMLRASDGILLEQKYGDEPDWEEHFDYLMSFFKDRRYLCMAEKPIFLFYAPDSIPCLERMAIFWLSLIHI